MKKTMEMLKEQFGSDAQRVKYLTERYNKSPRLLSPDEAQELTNLHHKHRVRLSPEKQNILDRISLKGIQAFALKHEIEKEHVQPVIDSETKKRVGDQLRTYRSTMFDNSKENKKAYGKEN